MGFDHACGEMLVVSAWVADEGVVGAVEEGPGDGVVGLVGVLQGGCGEVATEGAVDEEEGFGGEVVEPEGLGVVEGGEVEGCAAVFAERLDVFGGVGAVGGGEERVGCVQVRGGCWG